MRCPFCAAPNAPNIGACRVCGGPLRAAKPKPAPSIARAPAPVVAPPVVRVPVSIPSARAPRLLGRRTLETSGIAGLGAFAGETSGIAGLGALAGEGPRIGLVTADGALQLWDVETDDFMSFPNRRRFRKPGPVGCAAFAPQHDLVAMGHQNGQVRWLSLDGRALPGPAPHIGRALALAWTDTHFYSGGSDGVIWATPLGLERPASQVTLDGLDALTTLAIAPDGALLAVGRDDGAVQMWRLEEGAAPRLDWTRREHCAPIRSLAFSPNGAMIVSRAAGGSLCLWAAQTSYQLPLASGAKESGAAPAFSADSRLLLVAKGSGVAVFDVALEKLLGHLALGETVRHLACAPGADGAQWVVAAGERAVGMWEVGF